MNHVEGITVFYRCNAEMTKQNINKKWIVVTLNGERICWGGSKYILSHFLKKPNIQFSKNLKIEIMTKQEVFAKKAKKGSQKLREVAEN